MPDEPSADSIAARLTTPIRERLEQAMRDQMMRESELGAYTAEDVAELARHVI